MSHFFGSNYQPAAIRSSVSQMSHSRRFRLSSQNVPNVSRLKLSDSFSALSFLPFSNLALLHPSLIPNSQLDLLNISLF